MVYKPVLCELKCISRDIRKKLNEPAEPDETKTTLREELSSLKEDLLSASFEEWLMLIGLIGGGVIMWYILMVLGLSPWFATTVMVIFLGIMMYSFICYLSDVHQRCIQYQRG